ncbi:hypothetical protein N7495_003102 [Penicillium taxi]|uniref:uncharacterized protein n=1 Tax=Penicillium taxi TaxID=168475 RepID=UPI002545B66B|nr:uncharacterized protein N7495_003102 [Penicillium taxi]KAJ5902574.1 hypothetical protein N7495_003102 [Penicillium taxi]
MTENNAPDRPASAVDSHSPCDNRPDQREALELHEIQTQEDNELDDSMASASSGDEYHVTTRRATQTATPSIACHRKGLWSKLCHFWTHHVTLTVPHKSNRDHFALERTFLAYVRTSLVIAMQGVLIAQLFRLQRSPTAEDRLKFYQVGIPLAVSCYGIAIIVAIIGAYRFWRQQNAIALGKIYAGGWEINLVGILLCVVILILLVSLLVLFG